MFYIALLLISASILIGYFIFSKQKVKKMKALKEKRKNEKN